MNGLPIVSGFYYYWVGRERGPARRAGRGRSSGRRVLRLLQRGSHDRAHSPNALDPDFKTPTTDELDVRRRPADLQRLRRLGDLHLPALRRPSDAHPDRIGRGSRWELVGIATGTAVAGNGFTLDFNEPFYFLTLERTRRRGPLPEPPGATRRTTASSSRPSNDYRTNGCCRASSAGTTGRRTLPRKPIALDPNNRLGPRAARTRTAASSSATAERPSGSTRAGSSTSAGLYQFPWGINVAANFFGREGYPAVLLRPGEHRRRTGRPRLSNHDRQDRRSSGWTTSTSSTCGSRRRSRSGRSI